MSLSRNLEIAIVGAGLTGCLTALEFAERGHHAVLFERERDLLLRASTANEGKVHLGYVYAADRGFRTAASLIDDALLFRALLERWMTTKEFNACLFDTFDYVIPQSSSLTVDEIRFHFERVEARIRERKRDLKLDYLGQSETPRFSRVPHRSANSLSCFRTQERGVWPVGLAEIIRNCVIAHPRIRVEKGTGVDRFEAVAGKWNVVFSDAMRKPDGPFDIVVNAAWADRRNIDRKSGYPDEAAWFTRFKFGVLLENASSVFDDEIPKNTTAMSGSYGDSVYFSQNDTLYTSWYPVGMCFSTPELFSDSGLPRFDEKERLIRETWSGYSSIDPSYLKFDQKLFAKDARLIGDFIMAKGKSDIDNPTSELHQRVGNGPQKLDMGYWSVETGKFSSAPRCASECVDSALASI